MNLLMIMASNLIMIKYISNQESVMICEDCYKENWILLILGVDISSFSSLKKIQNNCQFLVKSQLGEKKDEI